MGKPKGDYHGDLFTQGISVAAKITRFDAIELLVRELYQKYKVHQAANLVNVNELIKRISVTYEEILSTMLIKTTSMFQMLEITRYNWKNHVG